MRKKQRSYNDMTKMIQEMQEQQLWELNRMAQVIATGLLNGSVAACLGDCSDFQTVPILSRNSITAIFIPFSPEFFFNHLLTSYHWTFGREKSAMPYRAFFVVLNIKLIWIFR